MKEEIFKLLKEIKPYKKMLAVIAITGILYSSAFAKLIMNLKHINDSFQTGDSSKVAQVGLFTMGLALVVAVSRYYHIFTMNYLSEIVVNNLRLRLQKKFMNLNLSFHTTYSAGSGGLISRIINDIRTIQDGLRMVADFFREPLLAIYLLFNLFYLNWRLTLAILILLPLILVFLKQISKSLRKYVHWGQENLEKMTSTIKESLDGVRIIQSYNLESELSKKLTAESTNYLDIRKKMHARIEVMSPIVEFIATAVIISIFFYFSGEIAKGTITTGDVLAYIGSLMAINQPIKKLQESYVRIQETIVASQRVHSILDNPSEVPQQGKNLPFPSNWEKITYKNVSFAYGNEQILKDISFEILRGEQIAFVGESGSGKSTIVNLLERFYDPTAGQILIDDINIIDINLKELRENIALVSQDVFLFNDTIERNIAAGKPVKNSSDIIASAQAANAHSFIQKTAQQYQTLVGDRGSLLSGGEKQRLSIARAFYKNSPILILDEATSALDSASEQEVQKGLEKLTEGRTSFVIAHRLSTIQNVDKIFVLKSGRIAEIGKHSDLISHQGEYFKFFNLQTRV